MSDPNQPPQYPGSEFPPPTPPPPPPPPYGQPPQYGEQPYGQQPQYGVPQYPTGPSYQQYAAPPPNPYAHWGYRVGGYLLDNLLIAPAYIAMNVGLVLTDDPEVSDSTQSTGAVIALIAGVAMLAFIIWNQVIRQGRTGSSLGKQWVGIAVVSERSGLPIGGWNTFGRALLHILDALPCYLGYLWPLWDDKRQTFADKIMKTVVVRRAPAQPANPPYYPPTYGSPQG